MLNVNRNYWFFMFCFLGFASMLQAQTQNGYNQTSTQNDTSSHILVPNHTTQNAASSTYTYGENSSFYTYGSPMISSEVTTSPSSNETHHYRENKEGYSSSSKTYQAPTNGYITSSTDEEIGSFVDEVLDLPSMNPASNAPQQRVVPVATVEDVHSIDREDTEVRFDRHGTLNTPKEDENPATRVVPVATVEDVHSIDRKDTEVRFDRHGTLNTPKEDENPATRVVPVATVEDVHEVKTEDTYGISRQPYQSQNPIVKPVYVERESAKERRKRQETTPQYPSPNYRPPVTENTREIYTIDAETEPKPKKRNFFEFIKDTFNEGDSDSSYEEPRSRPSRSGSSSSSSKEYSRDSSSSSSDNKATRTERKSRDTSTESNTRESRSNNN